MKSNTQTQQYIKPNTQTQQYIKPNTQTQQYTDSNTKYNKPNTQTQQNIKSNIQNTDSNTKYNKSDVHEACNAINKQIEEFRKARDTERVTRELREQATTTMTGTRAKLSEKLESSKIQSRKNTIAAMEARRRYGNTN